MNTVFREKYAVDAGTLNSLNTVSALECEEKK